MQRHLLRTLATSIYPLIGLGVLMALADCSALPTMHMTPTQASQSPAPSPDIFSGLAQRMNIMPQAIPGATTATASK